MDHTDATGLAPIARNLTDLPWTLASASPRRLALLRQVGIEPAVRPAAVEEILNGHPPEKVGQINARAKLEAVANGSQGHIILAADTLVVDDGHILGKPEDAEDAAAMLRRLSGREHQVITAFALAWNQARIQGHETTLVRFRDLSDAEISAYLATGEAWDKAGAYGIQGAAAAFVQRVNGCYFNVVGLPLSRVLVDARRLVGQEPKTSGKEGA